MASQYIPIIKTTYTRFYASPENGIQYSPGVKHGMLEISLTTPVRRSSLGSARQRSTLGFWSSARTRAGVEPWIFQPCLMTLKGIIDFRLHIPLYPHITESRLQHDVGIRSPENGWFFRCPYANGCYESNSQGSLDKSSIRSATWSHINPIKSVFYSQYSKNPIVIDELLILYLE